MNSDDIVQNVCLIVQTESPDDDQTEISVDPLVLGSRSSFFSALFSGKMADAQETKSGHGISSGIVYIVYISSRDKIEPTVQLIHMATSTSIDGKSFKNTSQDELFVMACQSFVFCFDKLSSLIDAELEQRIKDGLCHTFVTSPSEFKEGPGYELVQRASDEFLSTFEPPNGFANLSFEHVALLLSSNYKRAHYNCLFGFVVRWWKEAKFICTGDKRQKAKTLINALKFSAMDFTFLCNVAKVDETLCCGDESLKSLFKSRTSQACSSVYDASRLSPRVDQIHRTVIVCQITANLLPLASDRKDNEFCRMRVSDDVCVDGYYLYVNLVRSPDYGTIGIELCLNKDKTNREGRYEVVFMAQVFETISDQESTRGETRRTFRKPEKLLDAISYLSHSSVSDENPALHITARRVR